MQPSVASFRLAAHPLLSQMLFLVVHSFIFRRLAGTLALMS